MQRLNSPRKVLVFLVFFVLLPLLVACFMSGCATAPKDSDAGWSHSLTPVAAPHWVVFKVKLDKVTGATRDILAKGSKDALDCLALAKHITPAREFAEVRVCRQIGADGRPIDEVKVGDDDQPLHDGEDTKSTDVTT